MKTANARKVSVARCAICGAVPVVVDDALDGDTSVIRCPNENAEIHGKMSFAGESIEDAVYLWNAANSSIEADLALCVRKLGYIAASLGKKSRALEAWNAVRAEEDAEVADVRKKYAERIGEASKAVVEAIRSHGVDESKVDVQVLHENAM